jgi:hypothetical protein
VDHPDWALIEHFLADFGADHLPCQPLIEETPFGYDLALTMRLDCDEDIGSAHPLFKLYQQRGLPFSLAVMTGQEPQPGSQELLREVKESGGAILSHSATHAPNWGGSPEACVSELASSCAWLNECLPNLDLRYAVSPFHQSPSFLPQALKDQGLHGFIGGSIANDPETLVARGGILPNAVKNIVTHSQQCMLHGDCLGETGDPLDIPKKALAAASRGRSLFGFLDHPISPRYDYGWGGLDRQLSTHEAFLDHIAEVYPHACWFSANQALDWIAAKARLGLHVESDGTWHVEGFDLSGDMHLALRFKGRIKPLESSFHD